MTPADVDDIHAYQSREDVCRYLLFEPRDPRGDREGRPVRAAITLAAEGDYWQLAIERDGRVIGDSVLHDRQRRAPDRRDRLDAAPGLPGPRLHDRGGDRRCSDSRSRTLGLHRVKARPGRAQHRLGRAVPAPRDARGGLLRRGHVVQGRVDRHASTRVRREWPPKRSSTDVTTGSWQSAQVRSSSDAGRESEEPESPQDGQWKTVSTNPARSRALVVASSMTAPKLARGGGGLPPDRGVACAPAARTRRAVLAADLAARVADADQAEHAAERDQRARRRAMPTWKA